MTEKQKFEAWKRTMLDGFNAFDAWQARASQDRSAEWQPIETAPKDGTYIMVANYAGVWIATYRTHAVSGFRFDNPWFSLMLNRDHIPSALISAPTHWMPLPPPPKGQE